MIEFIPYIILGVPFVVFIVQFFKHGKMGGLQFIVTGSLSVIIFLYFILHTGLIGNYIVKLGDKDFYISTNAFEELIEKNLENFSKAITKAYLKYRHTERFNLYLESENVKYKCSDDGMFSFILTLNYEPIISTIDIRASRGYLVMTSGTSKWVRGKEVEISFGKVNEDKAKKLLQKHKLTCEVRYFQKMIESNNIIK